MHIAHLGISGFPYGFGAMQRLLLLYKGLQKAGAKVTVINRKGVHTAESGKDLRMSGSYEGVDYRYVCGSPFRPKGFAERNVRKVVGIVNEFRTLLRMKSRGELDAAMVYLTGQFGQLLYYWFISRILGFPIVLNYVEYRLAFAQRGLFTRLNDWLFDTYCARWCDGILPISEYLVDIVHKQTRKTPQLKVPVICDFEKFAVTPEEGLVPHFLYVGAASYMPLIKFVTEAFDQLNNPQGFELHLVLGGKPHQIEAAQAHIDQMQNSHLVHLTPNAPHTTIPQRLANASGLLIPMRPTVQDEARFPHKVGEYLASSTPLITTAFGEIRYYFRDEETALIADDYDPSAFADKMQYVIEQPVAAARIGENGRRIGLQEFNYITFGQRMRDFIAQIRGEEVLAEPVKHPAKV